MVNIAQKRRIEGECPLALEYQARLGLFQQGGMTPLQAIRSATLHPAGYLGLDGDIGSLEPGKQATFLITTGTPLDMTSDIEQSYIQGREIDMMDIQKWFFDKYMKKVQQYRRPVM